MNKALTIARRELSSYFSSPLFWILSAAFMFLFGFLFFLYVSSGQAQADLRPILLLWGTIVLFVTPLLSMRLLAEEQRSGHLEVLMTSPIRDWQLVFGKWLAAFLVYAIMVGLTLIHLGVLSRLASNGVDWGSHLVTYVGLLLSGGMLLALGTATSALTENQVVAAFVGVMMVMVLWFLSIIESTSFGSSAVGQVLSYAGLSGHFEQYSQGVFDSRDIVYFLSITFGSLFLATRILETRRWR